MASSVAVGADATRSPKPDHEADELLDTVGTIKAAPEVSKEGFATLNDRLDAAGASATTTNGFSSPKPPAQQDEDQQMQEAGDNAGEDLFGEDDEEMQPTKKQQRLADEELDSGDDEDRDDRRIGDEEAEQAEQQPPQTLEQTGVEVEMGRHPPLQPSDGEVYLMKIPKFLAFQPNQFSPHTFQPPTTDHHSNDPPSSTFSAYKTAMTTIRWRQSPSNPSQLQSNARIVRWSDGDLTLQFAHDPKTHYPIPGNSLAPSQRNPKKPTPTSKSGPQRKYEVEKDQFTYLGAPQEGAGLLRITNKLTTGLRVESATDASEDALERLQNSLAKAGNDRGETNGGLNMMRVTQDPELAKKKAELADKEMARAKKRREAAENRDKERAGRVLGRHGMGAGLTVGGLEDDDELGKGITRLPPVGGKKKQKKTNRRGEIYSEDEDEYGRRGRTREDEYDEEDDFVAGSDEEEEAQESDDPDDGIVEQPKERRQKSSPKRQTPPQDDAEGDVEEDAGEERPSAASPPRNKRRRIIEEDEDE